MTATSFHAALLALAVSFAASTGQAQSAGTQLAPRPLEFVANQGQWRPELHFCATQGRERVLVVDDGFWLLAEAPGDLGVALRFAFEGGAGRAVGLQPTPGRRHYLIGEDQAAHVRDVQAFSIVRRCDLQPGTDLVLRDGGGHLEYDLVLQPGARVERLRVRVSGHERLQLLPDGSLRIETAIGALRQTPPRSYSTDAAGRRTELASRIVLLGADEFGFAVEGCGDGELTIDPGLIWGSFLGGSLDDECRAVAFDSQDRVAVAGQTRSTDVPTTPGSYRPSAAGNQDAFVALFDAQGRNLVYCTFFGGSGDEFVGDLRALAGGLLAFSGWTDSINLPVTANRYQAGNAGGLDGFATILSGSGAALEYSTYYGGLGNQTDIRLWVAPNGDLHLAGRTDGTAPSTANAFQGTRNGQGDVFYGVLDRSQIGTTSLRYGSYYGGTGDEIAVHSLQVDGNGIATIGLTTNSTDCVVTGTFYQNAFPGGTRSGFIVCLQAGQPNPSASLVYASYFGAPGGDTEGLRVELDSSGYMTAVATTSSPNWPTTPVSFQRNYGGGSSDVIVCRIDPAQLFAPALMLLTYLGGSGADVAHGFRLTYTQNVTERTSIAGSTLSTDFPVTAAALQPTPAGNGRSGFVAEVDTRIPGSGQLVYGSYFDGCGSSDDDLFAIARHASGLLAVAGATAATVAPGTPGSFRTRTAGGKEGIVAVLDVLPQPPRFSTFGAGCGVAGFVPAITAGQPPRMCFPFSCNVTSLRSNAVGLMIMGLSNTNWLGVPLPLDLTAQGLTGCNQLISIDTSFLLFASGTSTSFGFVTPGAMDYYGVDLFLQFAMFDAAANPFGVALSNGARLHLQF